MNDITSFQTLIGTLYKKFNKASVYGILNLKKLYILDIINELLFTCPSCLSETNKRILNNIIIRLQHSDPDICIYRENRISNYNDNIDYNNGSYSVKNTPPIIQDPPVLDGTVILEKPGDTYILNESIFKTLYFDAEGDLPLNVIILTLPVYGILTFNNQIINPNFIFNISDSNKIKYERISNIAYADSITFKTSDNNINQLYSNMATFTINVNQYVNLPPDAIGDNEVTTTNRQTFVFSQADFTTNTTPPYDDPEGDGPYKLKVKTLPSQGLVKLNGINVTINQEILFTQINSGLLTYVPTDTNAAFSVDFDFDISDLGSQQFSGL